MVHIRNRRNHNNKNHYGLGNQKRYITIHDTGNTSKGANAEMHARYIANGSKETWHYSVDDKEAVQHFSHDTKCWHAGDGRGSGNLHSIGIEICINQDGNYTQAVQNAVELTQHLMKELNIPITHVKQHNHWSGKDCPRQLRNGRDGITWNGFIDRVGNKKKRSEERLYKVQTGAFKNRKNADDMARRLKNAGFDTYIIYEGVTPPKTKEKTVKELYDEVMAGKHGNGEQRKKSLGNRYQEVQDYINKRF